MPGFLLGIFFKGGGAKSIVTQISIVILLFSDQISGGGKSFSGGRLPQGGASLSPLWEKASRLSHFADVVPSLNIGQIAMLESNKILRMGITR